ncbi:hypothetical protein Daura_50270 [Dactylosporangium aurantiacum]|uniref:Uncharacterized protein n=1 Tax=Dactylosporangium aurantiacum TaxID=35754 RepID=A0A9Q9IJI0_9ACTN|nr:hypothetical protein [Dactylosporangium aurantiacum]MDG6109025.1 hypothetical protein [Dactylosporangium aurantiacum]UWZ54529.1 hypothetical protein Daura_50270 [Dactylosporangium aurantiacum]
MSTAPTTLNGRIIGQAERSTRAVLDRLLARTGTPFEQWVALNLTGTESLTRDTLVAKMAAGLRTDPRAVASVVDEAVQAGLLAGDIALTAQGRRRFEEISAGIQALTARLYGGLTDEELTTAGRVLLLLTDRANAELAAA